MSDLANAWSELVEELRARAPAGARAMRPSLNDPGRLARELGLDAAAELDAWFALSDGFSQSPWRSDPG